MSAKSGGHGNKTHEQQLRILERKDDMPKASDAEIAADATASAQAPHDPEARRSEFSVSRGGMHQESRDHNKHNHGGQSGHKPQAHHSPDEEKR